MCTSIRLRCPNARRRPITTNGCLSLVCHHPNRDYMVLFRINTGNDRTRDRNGSSSRFIPSHIHPRSTRLLHVRECKTLRPSPRPLRRNTLLPPLLCPSQRHNELRLCLEVRMGLRWCSNRRGDHRHFVANLPLLLRLLH